RPVDRLDRQPLTSRYRDKVAYQSGDVGTSLAQRRQPDRSDIQAIEQIIAKLSLPDQLRRVAMGRRDDPDIGADRDSPANRRIFALLQDAQQPGLRLGRHVADLVEKQRAALGLLKASHISRGGAGESTLFVAEQLAFDQLAGNRRHIDRDERPRAALAEIMQSARDQLLSGAAFA